MSKTKRTFDYVDMSQGKTFDKELYTKTPVGSALIDNCKLLLQAVKQGNDALVEKLLNAGVPPYVSDQLGCGSLFYAARYNHLNILKLLLNDGALVDVITKMGRTALQISAYHGHIDCLEYLLDMGANVDVVDNLGMSALHWASENGHSESVKRLLKAGANVGLVNKFGKTAEALALKKNHFEIYELLRDRLHNLDENTEFLLDEGLLSQTDKEFGPFTAVFIPQKNASYTNQKIPHNQHILQPQSKHELLDQCKLAFKANLKKHDTIKLFEQHGIKLLPVDQSTIIASALKKRANSSSHRSRKISAEKTEPNIIRKVAGLSPNLSSQPITKKQKIDHESNISSENPIASTTALTKFDNVDVSSLNKAKIIKIDAKQLVNLTANKKLIISKPKLNPSPVRDCVLQVGNMNVNSTLRNDTNKSSNTTGTEIENQLRKKSDLLRDMKKQLDLSLQLAKHYKSQYEMKEREAALYKIQLANLSKLLMKSGIKMSKIQY